MRMNMEKCLVNNYLLKHGMDYFGKRDFIYLDMMGTDDVNKEGGPDRFFWDRKIRETFQNNEFTI